jgi:hypothetical protein
VGPVGLPIDRPQSRNFVHSGTYRTPSTRRQSARSSSARRDVNRRAGAPLLFTKLQKLLKAAELGSAGVGLTLEYAWSDFTGVAWKFAARRKENGHFPTAFLPLSGNLPSNTGRQRPGAREASERDSSEAACRAHHHVKSHFTPAGWPLRVKGGVRAGVCGGWMRISTAKARAARRRRHLRSQDPRHAVVVLGGARDRRNINTDLDVRMTGKHN